MLCININKDSIIFSNKHGAQLVRLFYTKTLLNSYYNYNLTNKTIIILRLYVDPNHRKNNQATLILNLLFNIFKEYDFILVAKPDNVEYMSILQLINFYNKLGFIKINTTEDGILMLKQNICIS